MTSLAFIAFVSLSRAVFAGSADSSQVNSPAKSSSHGEFRYRLPNTNSARPEAPETSVDELITELSADKFQVRQAAMRKLIARGESALPALHSALNSPDAETRARAAEAIRTLTAPQVIDFKHFARSRLFHAFRSVASHEASTWGCKEISSRLSADSKEARLLRDLSEKKRSLDRALETNAKTVKSLLDLRAELEAQRAIPGADTKPIDIQLARLSEETQRLVKENEGYSIGSRLVEKDIERTLNKDIIQGTRASQYKFTFFGGRLIGDSNQADVTLRARLIEGLPLQMRRNENFPEVPVVFNIPETPSYLKDATITFRIRLFVDIETRACRPFVVWAPEEMGGVKPEKMSSEFKGILKEVFDEVALSTKSAPPR